MEQDSLYNFYEHAVLPQFGINDPSIVWRGSRRVEGDEFAHSFQSQGQDYILFFEDYADGPLSEAYIEKNLLPSGATFNFIEPTSHSNIPPSYDGFRLAAPSQYCENVTGVFTLLKLVTVSS